MRSAATMSSQWGADFFPGTEEPASDAAAAPDPTQPASYPDSAPFPPSTAGPASGALPAPPFGPNPLARFAQPPAYGFPFGAGGHGPLPPVQPRADPTAAYNYQLPDPQRARFLPQQRFVAGPAAAGLLPARPFGAPARPALPQEEDDWPADNRVGKQRVMTKCPQCGHMNHIRRKICQKCKAPKPPPAKRKRRRKRKRLAASNPRAPAMPPPMHGLTPHVLPPHTLTGALPMPGLPPHALQHAHLPAPPEFGAPPAPFEPAPLAGPRGLLHDVLPAHPGHAPGPPLPHPAAFQPPPGEPPGGRPPGER